MNAKAPQSTAGPNLQSSEYIRIGRVARLLDVSSKRVYHLVRDGELKAIRLGPRQMRIERQSVEALIGHLIEEETEREP